MATNITITKNTGDSAARGASQTPRRRLPGWLWFVALWCLGVASAMSLGFAFKILMNLTLFAVR